MKNIEEIYLHVKLGDTIWKLHSSAPSKNKAKSFRDKMQGAIRPRLNYTKVHPLNTNKNNWEYGTFVKMSNGWNCSTTKNKIKRQTLVQHVKTI